MKNPRYLTAKEAALLLGVSTLTLYAYVSRGLIRSEDLGAKTRIHRYYYEDVERLLRKKEIYRKPDKAAMYALNWGRPVLESSLTLIQNQRLYYRGQDAIQLAQTETFERVAALLWTGNMHDAVSFDPPSEAIRMVERARRVSSDTLTLLGRLIVTLTQMNDLDARAFDLDPAHLAVQGGRMVSAMTYALVAALSNDRIAAQVAARWCADPAHAAPLIDAALILCADHELNASSFAARVAASTGATLYMVVTAGLATLSGGKHGGATLRTAALLNDLARDCNVERHTASLFDVR
ncbi:MAG: citrate synthase, partial [Chloroflexota bacterium]|nr:citrate synthase [Chloroflexota bacterium]